jgi:hypothetical protein
VSNNGNDPTLSDVQRATSSQPQISLFPDGQASSSILEHAPYGIQKAVAGDHGTDLWNAQSLDSILGASVPDFDMSLYQALGQTDLTPTWPFVRPDSIEHSLDVQPTTSTCTNGVNWDLIGGQANFGYMADIPTRDPPSLTNTTTDEAFLNEFCEFR